MENMMKTMSEHFPARTVVIEQSLDMSGIKRNEDGTLLFPRHSDKRFPVARIRKRLAAYGWRGERLNKEVARIVAGPDILPERRDYSIIFPYGWEKKQLTEKSGHLAWYALVALAPAWQDCGALSPAQENLFLTRWLASAEATPVFARCYTRY